MKIAAKTSIVFVLSGLFASITFAAGACPTCDSAAKLTKELKALNYTNEADRSKGGLLALDAVKSLEQVTKLPKKDKSRAKAFSSALPMAREAAPYDGESQLAELLAASIKEDPKLKATYETYLKSLPMKPKKTDASKLDSCKTEQLTASVAEALCRMTSGAKGQEGSAKTEACVRPFNFEDCIK